MNWKQEIIKKHIQDTLAFGSLMLTEDTPESRVPLTEKAKADALCEILGMIDACIEKAGDGHLTVNEVRAVLGAAPTPSEPKPRRVAPRYDTIPAGYEAPEDYEPTLEEPDPYTYGLGFGNSAIVFCPDCGHAVRSGYSDYQSQKDADNYARENCPECQKKRATMPSAKTAEPTIELREQFIRDLESLVCKAEPTVRCIKLINPCSASESVVIHYRSTQCRVATTCSSLLCIAKSVFEALPY